MLCYRQIISISVWETEALILTHKPAFCLYQGRIQDVWGSHDTRKAPQRTLNLVLSIIGASKRTHAVFLLSMGTPREEIIKASLHSVNKNGLKNKNVYTDIIQITNSTRKYFVHVSTVRIDFYRHVLCSHSVKFDDNVWHSFNVIINYCHLLTCITIQPILDRF